METCNFVETQRANELQKPLMLSVISNEFNVAAAGECTETMSHIMVCRSANCLLCAASTDVAGIDVR